MSIVSYTRHKYFEGVDHFLLQHFLLTKLSDLFDAGIGGTESAAGERSPRDVVF